MTDLRSVLRDKKANNYYCISLQAAHSLCAAYLLLEGVFIMQAYKTVSQEAQDDFIERKSKFIGYCKPVTTEEEALAFIKEKKSAHWDATHNAYAYCLRKGQVKRYSDDGEPQGTAGVPTLDVIQKNNLTDVVVVVTRYFGGILLGGGGLVRAYSHGARLAVEAGGIVEMCPSYLCRITCSYTQYGKVCALIPSHSGVIDTTEFTDRVLLDFHLDITRFSNFQKDLTNVSCGELTAEKTGEKYFPNDSYI